MLHNGNSYFILLVACCIYGVFGYLNNDSSNCIFEDTGGSGKKLDLSSLSNIEITSIDGWHSEIKYIYSPCKNARDCIYQNTDYKKAMIYQTNSTSDSCASIAMWDNQEKYKALYNSTLKIWKFKYHNGHKCTYDNGNRTNRTLQLEFICNKEIEYELLFAQEPLTCIYQFIIATKLACVESSNHSNDDSKDIDGLSGGSILLVIIFTIFVLYCGGGCIFLKCQKIPHQFFWLTALPAYTIEGCKKTKSVIPGCK